MKKSFLNRSSTAKFIQLLLLIAGTSSISMAATFTVTKTADTNDGVCDADCSLREAIAAANSAGSDDVINFDPSTFGVARTITLTGTALAINNSGSLTINGTGPDLLTISGNNQSQVFGTSNNAIVAISGLAITLGNALGGFDMGGGIAVGSGGSLSLNNTKITNCRARIGGGAISSFGNLTITSSIISGNFGQDHGGALRLVGVSTITNTTISQNSTDSSIESGGGIYTLGASTTTTIENSSIVNNTSGGDGGGISNRNNGILIVNNSIISGNAAAGNPGGSVSNGGGGIYNASGSVVSVSNSSINENVIARRSSSIQGGGGIHNRGTFSLVNSTVSFNFANGSRGGGIFSTSGPFTLASTTIANNSAGSTIDSLGSGGGVFNAGIPINARNTIIADNLDTVSIAPDVRGPVMSQGFNLFENTTGIVISGTSIGNILGQDPQLAPLRNNGGTTNTFALQPKSPAIDAGDPKNFPAADQRGVTRPQDGDLDGNALPDIGAYERLVTSFTVTKVADTNDGTCDADCSLREAISATNIATTPDNVILFDSTAFNSPQTITLIGSELVVQNNGTLLILGPGVDRLTLSGNRQVRILVNLGSLAIKGITISQGLAAAANGNISNGGGKMVLDSVVITENVTAYRGGGIANIGSLIVMNSVISNNAANGTSLGLDGGGGIANQGNLTIMNSKVTGNSARSRGGGIRSENGGSVVIQNSLISGNTAFEGGGIHYANGDSTRPPLQITNSTVSGNMATHDGGGMATISYSLISLVNVTVAFNAANLDGSGTGIGGGIRNDIGTLNLQNSLIAHNIDNGSAPDFAGTVTSFGYNLFENTSGTTITGSPTGNILGQDPMLDPRLLLNGGMTPNHALRVGSPAIDNGSAASPALVTDQRGRLRPYDFPSLPNASGGNGSDIGAFERQAVDVSGLPFATVAGRVVTLDGRGIPNAVVSISDSQSVLRSVRTSSFGFYSFDNVATGAAYTFRISSKLYRFSSQLIQVDYNLTNVNFLGQD
ncbi:MAG: choice-of-anchor Q domain-containing protein [Pyrinomonadaceae bacterium]